MMDAIPSMFMRATMADSRKLTLEQKQVVQAWAYEREAAKYPGSEVLIVVGEDFDADGNVPYVVIVRIEAMVSRVDLNLEPSVSG